MSLIALYVYLVCGSYSGKFYNLSYFGILQEVSDTIEAGDS